MKKQYLLNISKRVILILILVCAQFLMVVQAQDTRDEEIIREMENYNSFLNQSARQKVVQSARSLQSVIISSGKNTDLHELSVSRIKNQYQGMSSQDIEALVMLVMFDLWKSEEQDLKEMSNEMQKLNVAKRQQRDYLEKLNKQKASVEGRIKEGLKSAAVKPVDQVKVTVPVIMQQAAKTPLMSIKYSKIVPVTVLKDPGLMSMSELDLAIKTTNSNLDTLETIDQLNQVAFQDAMQKQAQLLQLMSNISKMLHDTLKNIIQNLR